MSSPAATAAPTAAPTVPALPAPSVLTPDNHSPVVVIFAIILVCVSGTAALARAYLSAKQRLPIKLDDILYILALLFVLAMTATLLAAAHFGLGKHMDTLSSSHIDTYYKLIYSFHILGLSISTTLSKASIVALFQRILSERARPMVQHLLAAMVAIYGIFSFFALVFQCDVKAVWRFQPSNCPTEGKLFYAIIALNIVTDLILAGCIMPDIWKLKMTRKQRITIEALFGSRVVLVCIPSCFWIWRLARVLHKTSDQTWYFLIPIILEAAVVNFSFIATTLPRIHSYIAGLHGDLLRPRLTDAEHRAYAKEREERLGATTSEMEHSRIAEDESHQHDENEVPLKLVPSHENPTRTVHLCGPESDCRRGPAANCVASTHRSSDEAMPHDGDDSQASLYNDRIHTTQQFSITASGGRRANGQNGAI